jgi:hypothetical protein
MYKIRNAVLGILTLTSVSGAILAVPTEAAEQYVRGVYKAVPERFLSYPYGGSYLRTAKRSFGNPYVNPHYGSYYAPEDYYNYWAYYAPYYWNFYGGSSYGVNGCLQRPCR